MATRHFCTRGASTFSRNLLTARALMAIPSYPVPVSTEPPGSLAPDIRPRGVPPPGARADRPLAYAPKPLVARCGNTVDGRHRHWRGRRGVRQRLWVCHRERGLRGARARHIAAPLDVRSRRLGARARVVCGALVADPGAVSCVAVGS